MKNMKKSTRIILAVVIGTVLTALAYYLMLPPINVFSTGFWTFLLVVLFFYGLPLGVVTGFGSIAKGTGAGKIKLNKIFLLIAAVPVAVLILGGIISSTFFNALI